MSNWGAHMDPSSDLEGQCMTYVSSFLIDIGHGRLRWRVYVSDEGQKDTFVWFGKGHGDEILTEVIKRVLEEHRLVSIERHGKCTSTESRHILNIDRDGKILTTISAEELHS